MANAAVCTDCHNQLPDSILSAELRVPCPACGGIRRTYRLSTGGTLTLRGKLSAEARDPAGEIFSERIQKSDEFTEARLTADKSEPLKLSARRSTRVPGFDEETVRELRRRSFDLQGFKEVWVAPFQEECFLLYPSLLETDIAVAAYYIWEAVGRPDGEDQRHWFQAIEQLRGIVIRYQQKERAEPGAALDLGAS
jgi:hypothetical protein